MIIDLSAWGWQQWVYIGLFSTGVLISVCRHGKPREPYNGIATAISGALVIYLLASGGFL